mgnify:CR=1 FL=1
MAQILKIRSRWRPFQKTETYVLNIAENTVVSSFSCKMIVNLGRLYYNDWLKYKAYFSTILSDKFFPVVDISLSRTGTSFIIVIILKIRLLIQQLPSKNYIYEPESTHLIPSTKKNSDYILRMTIKKRPVSYSPKTDLFHEKVSIPSMPPDHTRQHPANLFSPPLS